MQHWLAFPWLRYVLWLMSGILLYGVTTGWSKAALGCSVVAALLLAASALLLKKNSPAAQATWGLLAFLMLSLFGYWRTSVALEEKQFADPDALYWWVRVEQQPVETLKRYRFLGAVWDSRQQEEAQEVQVYVPKDQPMPQPGQLLFVKGSLQQVAAPLNPHQFDNRAYLAALGITHQLFVRSYVQQNNNKHSFSYWKKVATKSSAYLLQVVRKYVPDIKAAAVVKAMVLGQRTELDLNLKQAYANAGVMHVLAVSGLHVGMVYALLYLLFPYLQSVWWQRCLWLLLVLLVLWSYAWLTGLAPSSLRATVMFTIVALGKTIKRRGNIYNSIALSAFVLLVWNPLLIRQVGFQLSYMAVIGIVYLQPRISQWYQPKQWFLKKAWELFAVSLAAQLVTFPLGLYYFHQFPTYFFIGNLLAVPLAFFILNGTLLLLLLHWLPFLNSFIGVVVGWLAQGLNFWVEITTQLPLSSLVATITALEALLLYFCLLGLLLHVRFRSFSWALFTFIMLLIFAGSGMARNHTRRNQQYLTIYQVPGYTLLHFVQGRKEALLSMGERPDVQQLKYHIEPARIQAGLSPLQEHQELPQDFLVPQNIMEGIVVMVWQGKRIAVVDGKQHVTLPDGPLPVDILLLRKNPKVPLAQLQSIFSFKKLVLDASNSQYYSQKLKSEANLLDLPLYLTAEQGAYHLPL